MFLNALRSSLLLALLLGSGWGALAAEVLSGPYPGKVERVVDGDTLAVRVTVWLQQDLSVLVRVRGIDAPEMRGKCAAEKLRARQAAAALGKLVAGGTVVLTKIEGDKYFGRVLADVVTPEGQDIGDALLAGGVARHYDGDARQGWCAIGAGDPADPEELAQAEARAGN